MNKKENQSAVAWKEPWYDTWRLIPAIVVCVLVMYFGVKSIVKYANSQFDCPHQAKAKAEAKAVLEADKKRQKMLKNTVSVTVTNGTKWHTNVWGEWDRRGGVVQHAFFTNVVERPQVESLRVCKDCGEVVDRATAIYSRWDF